MPRTSTIVGAAATLALAPVLALTLTAGLAAQSASAGRAVLAGQVIDAETGAPVGNTLLGLSRRRGPGPNTTPSDTSVPLVMILSDDDGRFVVRDIARGSYLLLATAPNYIISNHGQGRPGGPTHTIDLDGDEVVTGLTIKLWRHPVVTGTVTDEAGEPVVGATVRVLRRMGNGPGGEPRYLPGTQTTTDDRGIYRLTSLSPGEFLVAVLQTQVTVPASVVEGFVQSMAARGGGTGASRLLDLMSSSSAAPPVGGGVRVGDMVLQSSGGGRALPASSSSSPDAMLVYPTTLPGTSDWTSPTVIALEAGEERTGIDFHLAPTSAVGISGVVTADGAPAPNVVVRLLRAGGPALLNDNGFEAAATVTAADGSFALLGVTPGQYVIKALRLARPRLPPALAGNPAIVAAYDSGPPEAGARPPLVGAHLAIAVDDADVRGLDIALGAGGTASGRVSFVGTAPPGPDVLRKIGILLASEDGGLPGANLQIARLGEDGTFSIRAPAPGRYSVTGVALPPGWHLSGLTVDGRPLATALDLSGDDVATISITYTDRVAGIAGTARLADGTGSTNAEVVVFSADRRLWVSEPLNVRRPRIEHATAGGAYEVSGLLPGEYLVAAVDDADIPEVTDVAFFEAVSRLATRVTLDAGVTSNRDLTIGRIR